MPVTKISVIGAWLQINRQVITAEDSMLGTASTNSRTRGGKSSSTSRDDRKVTGTAMPRKSLFRLGSTLGAIAARVG